VDRHVERSETSHAIGILRFARDMTFRPKRRGIRPLGIERFAQAHRHVHADTQTPVNDFRQRLAADAERFRRRRDAESQRFKVIFPDMSPGMGRDYASFPYFFFRVTHY
jgi:hypothetical protein